MKKNSEDDYIAAIRSKYEEKKNGPNRFKASLAQLRNSCIRIFDGNKNPSDIFWFKAFWKFDFNEENVNLINKNINKFKAIGNFLNGINIPPDWTSIEMAAILVELPERPYGKFSELDLTVSLPIVSKTPTEELDNDTENFSQSDEEAQSGDNSDHLNIMEAVNESEENEANNDASLPESDVVNTNPKEKETEKAFEIEEQPEATDPPDTKGGSDQSTKKENTTSIVNSLKNRLHVLWNTIPRFFKKRQLSKIHYGLGTVSIMVLLVWSLNKTIFTPKNCMVWLEDHYEKIDCNDPEINGEIQSLDEQLLKHFRKVSYSDTLTFFDLYGNPLIWYSKTNGYYELFTHHGLHPVTEKTLKPITHTIINNLNSDPNQ